MMGQLFDFGDLSYGHTPWYIFRRHRVFPVKEKYKFNMFVGTWMGRCARVHACVSVNCYFIKINNKNELHLNVAAGAI